MNNTILKINKNKSVILIDGSYYVFYRYFATFRWYSFQNKVLDVNTIMENTDFINSFIKHMESDISKLCKKWRTDINNIIICSDCLRSDIWRNDLYSEYKGKRVPNINFNSNIYNIFNEVINRLNIKIINHDRLEADDIVFLIHKKLKNVLDNNIIIITNDNDYLQIADKNVLIFNMQLKDITLRCTKNPRSDLIFKAIFGDKSDNIHKIAPFITKELSITNSSMNEKDLNKWLDDNELNDKYNFNMELICFDNIPTKFVKSFYNKYKICYV